MSRRRRAEADGEPEREAVERRLTFMPFHTIPLGRKAQLDIDLVDGPESRSVSMRLQMSAGQDRPNKPGRPIHVFADQLPALIAALTGAAAAIDALPDDWPMPSHPQPHGTRRRPIEDTAP